MLNETTFDKNNRINAILSLDAGTYKLKFSNLVTHSSSSTKARNVHLFTLQRLAFSSLSDITSVCMPYFTKISPITFQRHPKTGKRTLRNRLASYLRVPVFRGVKIARYFRKV